MKDIRALDVKIFDTRKHTTPQKALHYATIFLYGICLSFAFFK